MIDKAPAPDPADHAERPWWMTGVLYQIYVRSFADSDGDGCGDLQGVIDHLDYLEWLGVAGIWLSPVTLSPNADWGYDVADFYAIQPELGTMEQLDDLIAKAKRRGIRVLLDLVPNHTSNQHSWFEESRSSRTAPKRDWYVWADPKPDGSAPNNWVSSFGGPAWTLDDATGQYYLHNHLAEQPDLNWWNEEVREAFDAILNFWMDRGVAGFRIDVCNLIIKDAHLRDNPPAGENDDLDAQLLGQRFVYNGNRPEVHDVIRRWRRLTEGRPQLGVLMGETPVSVEALGAFYGDGSDELHLAFNFPFISAPFEAEALSGVVSDSERFLPLGSWPAWTGSNHDMSRFSSRWAENDPRKARVALLMLLCLRGTPVLYQGDEIGLGDVPVPHALMRDPLGVRFWPAYAGRDAMRTPMPWRDIPGGGFTQGGVAPWLPLGDTLTCNVEHQRHDPGSMLNLARDLIKLRRCTSALQTGPYSPLRTPPGTWCWRRGSEIVVALNLTDKATTLRGIRGEVLIGTDRTRDGEAYGNSLEVRPWEGVVATVE